MKSDLLRTSDSGDRVELHCPLAMPQAGGFLWNRKMLLQLNCRGYVIAQFMQPEPSKYSHAPMLEQTTFMQPEQPFYAHHPGRFFFLKDEANGNTFSVPYEPIRRAPENFVFSVGKSDVTWQVTQSDLLTKISVGVPVDEVVELWTLSLKNLGKSARALSLYPFFSIGYMSWMNQSACYEPGLSGIVATSITPYQKLADYPKVMSLKDSTFCLHDTEPDSWEASRTAFEGEGGLHNPDAIRRELLGRGDSQFEVPVAALQYRVKLAPGESRVFRFLFGPARDHEEIAELRSKYFRKGGFAATKRDHEKYLALGNGCVQIETPKRELDGFVNHWLNRQVFYHGDVNRFTTDPQTRNYLQDNMGMVYIDPAAARRAFLYALGRQRPDGSMPEGIVIRPGGKLKYINEIPHTDHCVWLSAFLKAYLDETGDMTILEQHVGRTVDREAKTVFDCVTAAMHWLIRNRDKRGLSLIGQGDWCDPMNMVGPNGDGVSSWLSMATVYALKRWAEISQACQQKDVAAEMNLRAAEMSASVQQHLWDGSWFARGITDEGAAFGISNDTEGRIYLNPQSWSVLADIADDEQRTSMFKAVQEQLETPFGTMMLAPAYTRMREDIGRVTQKYPGSGENGAVYNHAAMFYILALYRLGEADRAFDQLCRALPGPSESDYVQRGQLPVFLPNYYRGAVFQFPRTAGRSSQLFHTGAASWMYRIVIEELFGLKGHDGGLLVQPQLPSSWADASVKRRFRGALLDVTYRRDRRVKHMQVTVDDARIDPDAPIRGLGNGSHHIVDIVLPESAT